MNVAVFFGGRSCEHNVSIVTGLQALADFPKMHNGIPVYIDETGVWHTGEAYAHIETYRKKGKTVGKVVCLHPSSPYLYTEKGKKLCRIDAALLCTHGAFGEDGCLQGVLETSGIPYTGSGVGGSAIGMDKEMQKRLFSAAGLSVLPYVAFDADAYVNDSYRIIERLKKELTFPIIVKPCNLGSSIGISLAHTYDELFAAVRIALAFDSRVVAENALQDFDEYNCAVLLGEPSEVEKPVGWKDFLTYEDKYLRKSTGTRREFPAAVTEDLRTRIREAARVAYAAVGAGGVARVDFLHKDGALYVNEINTIPGSLAAYFYEGGTPYVIEKLLQSAKEVHGVKERRTFAYKPFSGEGAKGGGAK